MIKLPLDIRYKKDISKKSKEFIIKYNTYYIKENNKCLCSSNTKNSDILLSSIDIIGVSEKFLLCKNCSLVRLDNKLIDSSLGEFYTYDYIDLYINSKQINDEYFNNAISINSRSLRLFNVIKNLNIYNNINNIFEIGCGAGWNLWPYFKDNKNVSGCDFGKEYLEYGKKIGLDLYLGALDKEKTKDNSQDLIILSHILEHIPNPIEFLLDTVELLDDNRYLLIEVPGIQNGKESTLTTTFQIPHIYTYNKDFFIQLVTQLGLIILFIDDEITCVVQKPNNWERPTVNKISSKYLEGHYAEILKYIKFFYIKKLLKVLVINILEKFHLKKIIKVFK